MTTTSRLREHALCSHPTTKAARAKCRREGGAAQARATYVKATAPAKPKPTACACTGKPKGFHANADGVWVCVTCERPTAGYIANVLAA